MSVYLLYLIKKYSSQVQETALVTLRGSIQLLVVLEINFVSVDKVIGCLTSRISKRKYRTQFISLSCLKIGLAFANFHTLPAEFSLRNIPSSHGTQILC